MKLHRSTVVLAGALTALIAGCADEDAPTAQPTSTSATASPTASPTRQPAPDPIEIDKPPTGAPVADPALREELLAMLVLDQAVRTGVAPPGDPRTPDQLAADWDETDRLHNARMVEILDQSGWPGWTMVGSDGAFAAWVLIQHADLDLPLQKRGLELMQAAVDAGEADPSDLAYLIDRVRVAEGQPQVYGTQWGSDAEGNPEPRTPIEDEPQVDIRRAAVGLGTIDEYLEEMASFYEDEDDS